MDGIWMDERDLETEHPAARRCVDQLGPGAGKIVEGGANVVDLVRDVVHARPALREEAADGRVLPKRSEQLDTTVADTNRRRFNALVFDTLTMFEQLGLRVIPGPRLLPRLVTAPLIRLSKKWRQ